MPRTNGFLRVLTAAAILSLPALHALHASPARSQLWNIPICTAPGDQFSPVPVSDGAGGAIVAWIDSRAGGTDIYTHHVLRTGVIDPSLPWQGVALCTAPGARSNLRITADGAGGAIVVWEDTRGGAPRIYAHHVQACGLQDPAWPADGMAVCSGPGDQRVPALDYDGLAGAVIAWQDRRGGPDAAIFAQHVQRWGSADWAPEGVAVSADPVPDSQAMVVSDHAGGAIVVYFDSLTTPMAPNILAQHVRPAGDLDPAWPAGGLGIPGSGRWGEGTVCVTDGSGGAIVADADLDDILVAYHVLSSGTLTLMGALGGVPMHHGMVDPAVAPDGKGGAVAAWIERYYVNGDPYPPTNWRTDLHVSTGVYVPGAAYAGIQASNPVLISDGEGGAIVAWLANGVSEPGGLYVGHVLATGDADPNCPAGGKWISGAPSAPQLVPSGIGGALLVWQVYDAGTGWDIEASWLPGPEPTDVLASLASAEATPECVSLAWACGGHAGVSATVYRSTDGTAWEPLAVKTSDGEGLLRYEDRAVRPGDRYGYRLGILSSGQETAVATTWVRVPEPALALAPVRPNPCRDGAEVRFTLPHAMRATLELFDAGGREVRCLARGDLDAGEHMLRLAGGDSSGPPLGSGLYFLRLDAGGRQLTTRVALLR